MTPADALPTPVRHELAQLGARCGAPSTTDRQRAASEAPSGTASPEHSDAVLLANTGHTWQHWRAQIDAWPGHDQGHGAVAAWLEEEHDVPGWWAQAITVGWERLTGRRLPHQMADGTFTANRSATITADAAVLAALLRDETGRTLLFPGLAPQLRSRVTSKNVRIALASGVVEVAVTAMDDGRVTVTIQHAKLPVFADVAHWRSYWGEWLGALDGATSAPS